MPQDCSASVSQLQSSCGRAYGTALANHASSVMLAGLGAAASLREGGRMMKSASTQGALGHNHTRVNAENKNVEETPGAGWQTRSTTTKTHVLTFCSLAGHLKQT